MQAAVLVALLAIATQVCTVSGRRYSPAPDQSQESAAPYPNDLNRTQAHAQPQPPRAGSPPTAKPWRTVEPNEIAPARGSLDPARPSAPAASLAGVRSKWRQMEQTVAKSMTLASSDLKKSLDEIFDTMGRRDRQVSKTCRHSLGELVEGLREQELWAVHMMDSSAAFRGLPSGLLEGTLTDLGHFDQCLAIGRRPLDLTSGQYCSVLVKPPLVGRPRLHTVCRRMPSLSPMLSSSLAGLGAGNATLRTLSQQSHQFYYAGLRLGVCVPSGCSLDDVERMLQAYLNRFELIGQVKHCQRAAGRPEQIRTNSTVRTIAGIKSLELGQSISENFDLLQQYILLAYGILFALIVIGTLLDNSHTRCRAPASHGGALSTAKLAAGQAACTRDCHQGQHRYHDRSDGAGAEPRPGRGETEAGDHLGPQKNPLVSFASPSESPTSSKPASVRASVSLTPAPDHSNHRGHRDETRSPCGLRRDQSAKAIGNIFEPPIYDEIRQPGGGRQVKAGRPPGAVREFFICFSLKSNMRSIAKVALNHSNTPPVASQTANMADIKVIHGLRTLSMVWIVFGHTIGLVSPEMMNNLFALADLSCTSRFLQAVLNTTLAVDTFYMISGLVTVVSFARRCSSSKLILARPQHSVYAGDRLWSHQQATRHQPAAGNDYQATLQDDGHATDRDAASDRARAGFGASYSVNPASQDPSLRLDRGSTGLDGLEIEVTSVDSASSIITSLSSSASSNRCIGLSSKSSSQQNFIANKPSSQPVYSQPRRPTSGWPADFRPLSWLVMRYIRLTPAYAAIIGLSILMPALGSGPFWPETVGQLGAACRANWWANLLYVNNFIETDNLCLIHSWYLSNDWQFFLVALVLFGLAYKSRKLALLVLVSLLMGSSARTFIVSVDNDFPPTIVTTSPAVAERWEFIHTLYYKPWPHLPSFLLGMIVGCSILKLQLLEATGEKRPAGSWLDPPPTARLVCWILSSSTALAVLNSIYPWNMGLQVDPILAGLHSATFRTLWAACCGWLVFALVGRPRNPVALLLSWHGFQITSRLTYCAYLVHPLVIIYHFGVIRERIDSSIYGQLHRFMATLLISYLFAFIVSICFESPFIRLQNYLIKLLSGQAASGHAGIPGRIRSKKNSRQLVNECDISANLGPAKSSTAQQGGGAALHSARLTRNQLTGQFIVRPAYAVSHRHLDELAAEYRRNPRLADGQMDFHDAPLIASNQRGPNHSALDEEFQKKLAQAIGRGFKIRSKIVNGPSKQMVVAGSPRRSGEAKRVSGSVGPHLASMYESGSPQHHAQPQQSKPIRRTETFSTFVSPPTGANAKHAQGNGSRH